MGRWSPKVRYLKGRRSAGHTVRVLPAGTGSVHGILDGMALAKPQHSPDNVVACVFPFVGSGWPCDVYSPSWALTSPQFLTTDMRIPFGALARRVIAYSLLRALALGTFTWSPDVFPSGLWPVEVSRIPLRGL